MRCKLGQMVDRVQSAEQRYARYNFKSDPRSIGAVVVLSANESSYTGKSCTSPVLEVQFLNPCKIPDRASSIKERLIRPVCMTSSMVSCRVELMVVYPIAWYQEHGAGVDTNGTAGRSFYTSLGHLNETWQVSSM